MKKVVVLLPTYNEKNIIEKFAKEVLEQEKNLPGYKIELLIADSKSPDGTGEIAKKLADKNPKIHFLSVERGLGVAIIKGHQYSIKYLNPDVLAQLDADGQVDAVILPKLVKGIEEGYTLILGSRFVKGGKNMLSLSRRLFSAGASFVCRIIMGPFNIREFTNSARAFTPELFKKINLEKLPWREKTFIIQPAFLHEAIEAGAKYKEMPLIFKNRAEGYSKNKIVNYVYDIFSYTLDIRLHKMGINIPLFLLTRRAKTMVKFGVVGTIGTVVDFFFYNIFISKLLIPPATAKAISTEIAIVNNFILNNYWTFRHRKTSGNIFSKFGIFNLVSLGGLGIAVIIIKILHILFGDGVASILGLKIAYYNIYFLVTIPPVMGWNFTINHFVTFRHKAAVEKTRII
ncbi:GtrA family protein [Candidatus Daviesbacteria bacterium]|nr:GtrA family protein [Candidatus Daviesbacteria bacterium]